MMRWLLILALLAPPLRATWERPGVARVSWHGAGCLYHGRVFYKCYQESGVVVIGASSPLDAAYRPSVGSVYTLVRGDGTHERAPLVGRVYLPVWRG